MKRLVYALILAGSSCAHANPEPATLMTQIAHGTNAMYEMHATLCGTPERLATKECQKAAGYYEVASCAFEKVQSWLGPYEISEACKP